MARRILTVADIDELLSTGQTEFRLEPSDIVTALAKEHAQQRGVRLVPATQAAAAIAGSAPAANAPAATPADDRAAVRRAVIAKLGHEPDGLDAIIAKVMG